MSHASTSERTKRTEAIIEDDMEKVFSYVRKGMVHHAIMRLEVLEQHWGEYLNLVKPKLMPPQRIYEKEPHTNHRGRSHPAGRPPRANSPRSKDKTRMH